MKKAKIDKINPPQKGTIFTADKFFSIYYNDKTKKFTSARDCVKFTANLTKTINCYFAELNHIYSTLFSCYRSTYQMIDNEVFITHFKPIDQAFSKVSKYSGENRNVFIFRDAYLIINQLFDVCTIFHNLELSRKNYEKVHFYRMVLNRLENIKGEIIEL